MLDFYAAYLPNKYWGRASVVVPANPVVLDERFKSLNDLYLNHDKREAFDIYWIEQGVAGNLILPGELNYAYLNGKYYHLEKVSNQGVFKNGGHDETEWGYYMEYDDWQNDWLTNGIHLEGTISKTGDFKLAKAHIVQLSPIITGCSNYKFYLSGEEEIRAREVINNWHVETHSMFSPEDVKEFNRELNQIVSRSMETAERERLRIPIALGPRTVVNTSHLLFAKINDFLKRPDLKVFDVKKDVLNFAGFKTKHKINQVYCITTKEYHSFEVAESENQHARVRNRIEFLNDNSEIEYLNPDLTVKDERAGTKITFNELVEKWLRKYPNVTSTKDKGEFKFIAFDELYTSFKNILMYQNRDLTYRHYEGGFIRDFPVGEGNRRPLAIAHEGDLNKMCNPTPFPNERLRALNGVYQPGTDPKKIFYLHLREYYPILIRKGCGTPIDIGKKFQPKTPTNWWSTNNPEELEAWLNYLVNQRSSITLYYLQLKDKPNEVLKGNLLLNQWNWTLKDKYYFPNYIFLIPDYRSRGWVLARSTFFFGGFDYSGLRGWNYFDRENPLYRRFGVDNRFTIIREIGLIGDSRQTTWLHPLTDTILKNDNRRWSKYGFIIPLIVRWNNNYAVAKDSYDYSFYYQFTKERWKKVKEPGSNTFENKRLSLLFQFPLSGCGFDIYELLKEYKDLKDKYLRWNFICADDYKAKQKWEDKGGEFENFYDVGADSSNEPVSRGDRTKDDHSLRNEGIEIRIYHDAGDSKIRVHQLIFKLWVYYFGWRWDGSYNGAVPFTNYGSDNGYVNILWAKPFNRRWFICGAWINNAYTNALTRNKEIQSDGFLTYGRGQIKWDPKKRVYAIGYNSAYDLSGHNTSDIKHLLTSNVKEVEFKINTDGDYEKINTFETTNLEPVKFSHLLYGDKPWENIRFTMSRPDQGTFGNYDLGKRLKDVVRDMTYTTNRTINPRNFNPWLYKPIDELSVYAWNGGPKKFQVIENDYIKENEFPNPEIPFFIYDTINPDNIASKFKHVNFTGSVEDSFKNFRSLLQQELHNGLTILNSRPFIFNIKGSEFIGVAKYNVSGDIELELISKSNASIETVEAKEYIFNNPNRAPDTFEEFVRRLSSQFEISLFGQRIPIKTRPDTTNENIDIGLKVTPINDPKQSNTSLWYMVEIRTTQDTQRVRIEVPKELNAMNIQNPYEREHMIRTLAYHNRDRQLEKQEQLDEISKYSVDLGIKGYRMDINRNREITGEVIGMAQTSIQAAQAMGLTGWFGGGAAIAGAGMAASLAGQTANMVYSKQLYDLDRTEHMQHASFGMAALGRKAEITRNKHELAEQAERMKLYNMQTNINYPTNTDALMFREENKQMNLTDIHLTQYYPDGDLLNFLVDYYREYGFNVIVPNQRCFGVEWITGHIQFVKITNNVHPNETIRKMIEERALRGVTLDNNDDWHADKLQDLTGYYSRGEG